MDNEGTLTASGSSNAERVGQAYGRHTSRLQHLAAEAVEMQCSNQTQKSEPVKLLRTGEHPGIMDDTR